MLTGVALVVVAALAMVLTLGRGRQLSLTDGRVPSLSVIVPARDEAATLPLLLRSITAGSTQPVEVLVVDDGSTDATASVARSLGATVITPTPRPADWNGKPWACAAGTGRATGDLLVFLDADTQLSPDALVLLARECAARGGLVSVQPSHHPVRPVEQLSAIFNLVAVTGSGMFGLVPAGRVAAFGPCLVTTADDLARAGGWGSVRGSVIEDVELAQHCRAHELPVTCLLGGAHVRFRMYRTLDALVEGWTKNIAAGALAASRLSTLATAAWLSAVIATDVRVVRAVVDWAGGGGLPTVELGCYAVVALGLWSALRRVGRFRWWTSAAHIGPVVFFVFVFGRSLWLRLLGRPVRWRGRDVATRRGTP